MKITGDRQSDTRREICKAALALIREGGPNAATARAICERVGVTAPTLYHHFGDLPGLHRAVVEAVFAEAVARKGLKHSDDPYEEIANGWDIYVGFAREEPSLFALMNREISDGPLPPSAVASFARLKENVERLAAVRALPYNPSTIAQMTWAAAHGTACLAAASTHGFDFHAEVSAALKEAVLKRVMGI